MKLDQFTRLPSRWIEGGGLKKLRWGEGIGANNVAALMALAGICHRADQEDGSAKVTYGELCLATGLSRTKLAAGLRVLSDLKVIARGAGGRSSFQLCDYDPASGWAVFPTKPLYRGEVISAFADMHLRHRAELDALKLFYLFVSRRDRQRNVTVLSYEKIEAYSGVSRNNIRTALSFLTVRGLVHVNSTPSSVSEYGSSNEYRIAHIEPRHHKGTSGRQSP